MNQAKSTNLNTNSFVFFRHDGLLIPQPWCSSRARSSFTPRSMPPAALVSDQEHTTGDFNMIIINLLQRKCPISSSFFTTCILNVITSSFLFHPAIPKPILHSMQKPLFCQSWLLILYALPLAGLYQAKKLLRIGYIGQVKLTVSRLHFQLTTICSQLTTFIFQPCF